MSVHQNSRDRIANVVSGLLVLVASIVTYVWIIPLEIRDSRMGGATPHAFPSALIILIGIMGALLVLQQFLPKKAMYSSSEEQSGKDRKKEPKIAASEENYRDPYKLFWPWLLITVAFLLVLGMQTFGFLIGATIGLIAMLFIFGESRPFTIVIIAISAPLLTKVFFQFVMGIRLPESPFPIPFL